MKIVFVFREREREKERYSIITALSRKKNVTK